AYHGLTGRTEPCEDCPTAKMFRQGKGPVSRERMVIGFQPGSKGMARPAVVTSAPLYGQGKRIVGAIEIVEDTEKELESLPREAQDEWLRMILERIFLKGLSGKKFTRARLFLLSPGGEYLFGRVAAGEPELQVPVTSIRIPRRDDPPTLPKRPAARHISEYTKRNIPIPYFRELHKKRAPYWGDLSIKDEQGGIIGKVIVDRWSRSPREQRIQQRDLKDFERGLELLSRVLTGAKILAAEKERIVTVDALQNLMDTTSSMSSVEGLYGLLLRTVRRFPGVLSAIIREPVMGRRGKTLLRRIKGFGAYARHCVVDLPPEKSELVGALFASGQDSAVHVSSEKSLRLRKKLADISPARDRDELRGIKDQGSFRIKGPEKDIFLCVQADSPDCFSHGGIELVASAGKLALDSVFLRQYPLRDLMLAAALRSGRFFAHRVRGILTTVSHDLYYALNQTTSTRDILTRIRAARNQAQGAQNVVGDFVEFTRREVFLCEDDLRGQELLRELGGHLRSSLAQRGARVTVRRPPELPPVRVNLEELKGNFLDLLRDSERHRPSGLRITLSAGLAGADDVPGADPHSRARYVKITYADNGPGVSHELKQRIFDLFLT
ncbi:hypothetical protein LCGC14_2235340, partial [marine sediment metagenome]